MMYPPHKKSISYVHFSYSHTAKTIAEMIRKITTAVTNPRPPMALANFEPHPFFYLYSISVSRPHVEECGLHYYLGKGVAIWQSLSEEVGGVWRNTELGQWQWAVLFCVSPVTGGRGYCHMPIMWSRTYSSCWIHPPVTVDTIKRSNTYKQQTNTTKNTTTTKKHQ